MRTATLALMLLAGLSFAAYGASPAQDESPTELEPLLVPPPQRYEGDRQLLRLRAQLPELGAAPFRRDWVERVLDADPNRDLSPEQQSLLTRMVDEDPRLNGR